MAQMGTPARPLYASEAGRRIPRYFPLLVRNGLLTPKQYALTSRGRMLIASLDPKCKAKVGPTNDFLNQGRSGNRLLHRELVLDFAAHLMTLLPWEAERALLHSRLRSRHEKQLTVWHFYILCAARMVFLAVREGICVKHGTMITTGKVRADRFQSD